MLRFLLPCFALLLAACGQKGPLYLPAPAPVMAAPAPVQPPADAGQDEKDTTDAPAATPQP